MKIDHRPSQLTEDAAPGWVPESCSLPTVEQPLRVTEFDQLFTDSVVRLTWVSATQLDMVLTGAAEVTARDLAAREDSCCSFFTFDFTTAGTDIVMSVAVPESRVEVLDALADRVAHVLAGGTQGRQRRTTP